MTAETLEKLERDAKAGGIFAAEVVLVLLAYIKDLEEQIRDNFDYAVERGEYDGIDD